MSLFAAALTVGAGLLLQKIAREAERVEQENRDAMQVDEQFDATIEASSSIASGSLDPNLQRGTCSACLEEIVIPSSPSLRYDLTVQYGLNLSCPFSHTYCLTCFEVFIKGKLHDAHQGKQIFPLRCPDCSPAFSWSLSDETIRDAIPPQLFQDWSTQRYLDNLPKMYCPNPRCSEVIALPTDAEKLQCWMTNRSENESGIGSDNCPRCGTSICVDCQTISHPPISCSLWQRSSLNPALSNPSDLSLRRLAKRRHWRRCSKCRIVVEKTEGCSHMTCRCGHQFCHLCGSDWAYNGCTNSNPGACDGRRWRNDPSLHVPSRWKGAIQRTVLSIQKTPEKLVVLGIKTKARVASGLKFKAKSPSSDDRSLHINANAVQIP